jgi:hypothetical protein
VDLSFAQEWTAEILSAAPMIAPARQFVYPMRVPGEEEAMARGSMWVRVRPGLSAQQPQAQGGEFLATCALGFTDAAMPRGVWACPKAAEMCVVAGGYAYVVDTAAPERCVFLSMRPVVEVRALVSQGMLLFRGFHTLMAWGRDGLVWETKRLSWEGLRLTEAAGNEVRGFGWDLMSDREVEFVVDLRTGEHRGGGFRG